MQAPVDYPIHDSARTEQFSMDELTYSVLLDRMEKTPHPESAKAGDILSKMPKAPRKSRKYISTFSVPLLTPLFKPLAEATQSLRYASGSSSTSAGVFSRWGRTVR